MNRSEILKTAKPILFNTEMVKAILDGRKTVTRRVIKNNPCECTSKQVNGISKICDDKGGFYLPEEYVKVKSSIQVSDILYVRETFFEFKGHYYYKADGKHITLDKLLGCSFFKWRPCIHMPKEAARIFLRVTGVRVEKLQDITEEDVKAEGVYKMPDDYIGSGYFIYTSVPTLGYCWAESKDCFHYGIWNSTVKKSDLEKYGWEANPWVWVIEFERVEVTE